MHHRYYLAGGPEEGELPMPDGSIRHVEFWGVTGLGATHEKITRQAAKAAGYYGWTIESPVLEYPGDYYWDVHLYNGCAWPDVPCKASPYSLDKGRTDLPATNYGNFAQVYVRHLMNFLAIGNLAYESHFARNQNWHSMCPCNENSPVLNKEGKRLTNADMKEKILRQLGEWYRQALERRNTGKPGIGLMNLGKMLHTVQDSYALSHAWRRFVGDHVKEFWPKELHKAIRENELKDMPCGEGHHGTIWNFQSYHTQDGDLHGVADKSYSVGYDEALEASIHILKSYKAGESWEKMQAYLDKTVYVIHPERQDVRAGDSHPWFRKRLTEEEEPDEKARNLDEDTTRSGEAIMNHIIKIRKMVDDYKKSKGKTASASADAERFFDPYGELICAV